MLNFSKRTSYMAFLPPFCHKYAWGEGIQVTDRDLDHFASSGELIHLNLDHFSIGEKREMYRLKI